jgi:hypothetical protein
MLEILVWIVAGVTVLFVGSRVITHVLLRKACRAGAQKIHASLLASFQCEHEYRAATRDEFPGMDWSGYDDLRDVLDARGMTLLGGIEDVTESRANPEMRTLIEMHVGFQGTVSVATYRVQGMQIVDVISELTDGRMLLTTNAEINKLTPPPNTRRETLPASTRAEALLDLHLERLHELRKREPGAPFVIIGAIEDVLDAARRSSRTTSEHRRSIGWLTREELLALSGAGQEAMTELVWVEFCRIQDQQRAA